MTRGSTPTPRTSPSGGAAGVSTRRATAWPCCDAAGVVVAYATVMASPTFRDALAVYLEGRVRPDLRGRGIGRALLAWQLDRGPALHAERHPEAPGALTVEVPGGMPSLEGLVRRAGLAAERWYREMQRPLTDLPDAAAGRRAPSSCRSPGTATTRSGGRTTRPSPGITAPPSGTRRPGGRCSPASAASAPTCPASPSRTAPSSATCWPTSTRPTRRRGARARSSSARSASFRRRAAAGWRRRSSPRCCGRRRSRTARARGSASTPRT